MLSGRDKQVVDSMGRWDKQVDGMGSLKYRPQDHPAVSIPRESVSRIAGYESSVLDSGCITGKLCAKRVC